MCIWGFEDVYLEEPPPKKKEKEKPKDENTYIMMPSEMQKPAEAPVEAPVSPVSFVLHVHKTESHLSLDLHISHQTVSSVIPTP